MENLILPLKREPDLLEFQDGNPLYIYNLGECFVGYVLTEAELLRREGKERRNTDFWLKTWLFLKIWPSESVFERIGSGGFFFYRTNLRWISSPFYPLQMINFSLLCRSVMRTHSVPWTLYSAHKNWGKNRFYTLRRIFPRRQCYERKSVLVLYC